MIQVQHQCQEHREQALFKDSANYNQLQCGKCVERLIPELKFLNQDQSLKINAEKTINQFKTSTSRNRSILENIVNFLKKMQENIQKQVEQINKIIGQSIYELQKKENELKCNFLTQFSTIYQVEEEKMKYNNILFEKKLQIYELFSQMSEELDVPKLQMELENLSIVSDFQSSSENFSLNSHFNIQQIHQYKQAQECCAIAINNDSSLVVGGNGQLITVFDLINGRLYEKCNFQGHDGIVSCLEFMKMNSNFFVSAGFDGKVKIWQQSNSKAWILGNELREHKGYISALIIGKNNDEIIAGGQEKSVLIWRKENGQWKLGQKLLCHEGAVISLSLNKSQQKLISSGEDGQILVYERQSKNLKQFNQIQSIQFEGTNDLKIKTFPFVLRLSFMNDDQFFFLTPNGQFLCSYKYYQKEFQEEERYEVSEKQQFETFSLFPSKYIEGKNLMMLKHGKSLIIIKILETGNQYELKHIDFNSNTFFGTVNEQGNLLIVWKEETHSIQVHKLYESD